MRLKLLYNPAAGRGRARKYIGEAETCLLSMGAAVDVEASNSPAHLTALAAQASRAGYDRVVVCGGDGSLNLAVRELDLQQGTLALLPLGSGDDFAHVLGIPQRLDRACDLIVKGKPREVDVALANGIRYLGVAGLGFDSEVAAYANENAGILRGSHIYLYAILRILPRFLPHRVRLRLAEGTREEHIMFAVVGNSRQYGGGIRITPRAVIDDRILDLCIVHRTSRAQLLKTLPLAYTGMHVNSPFVETGRGVEFHFESDAPLEVYADGERLTRTPVSFTLAEEKLRIIAP
ncbi:MAG TPA: diacylglycerol kinase family protein [Thermoanaerobaculia bacterium]|nr:diacylglycerol kinase family protein [Thermoanaerobaculia bacterium]